MPISVFLIDDDAVLREAMRTALTSDDFEVCGEADGGPAAFIALEELTPDIILCDFEMPEMSGAEVLGELRTRVPDALVAMLTSVRDRQVIMDCVKKGASDFILKADAVAEILPQRLLSLWQRKGPQATAASASPSPSPSEDESAGTGSSAEKTADAKAEENSDSDSNGTPEADGTSAEGSEAQTSD